MDAASQHATGADGPYWNALAAGRLELPRCTGCGVWHWPAVFRCGECGTWEPKWEPVALRGRVFSWTRSWHAYGGSEGLGLPYVSLIVELPQAGDRRVLGVLSGDAADLKIGASVVGEVAATPFGESSIPSIRWTVVEALNALTPDASGLGLPQEETAEKPLPPRGGGVGERGRSQ